VAVLISDRHCIGNQARGFRESIDSMNTFLAARARAAGIGFVAVGISLDWEPDSGFAYLQSLSHFDEIVVGRNWFNVAVAHYIWADSTRVPAVPQVLLLERTTTMGKSGVTIGQERLLAAFTRADSIVGWVRAGTPIP
jgi:hypothetical protein